MTKRNLSEKITCRTTYSVNITSQTAEVIGSPNYQFNGGALKHKKGGGAKENATNGGIDFPDGAFR